MTTASLLRRAKSAIAVDRTISPSLSSDRRAPRMVVRLTWNRRIRSTSGGIRSPVAHLPDSISVRSTRWIW